MFDELDDPTPPRPTGTTRIRVHARAAKLQRRTNAIRAGVGAVVLLLLVGVLTVFARRDNAQELDTAGSVTTTTNPIDLERGEIIELDASSVGGTLVERRTMNDPTSGAFELTLAYVLEDGDTFGVTRLETTASSVTELKASLGPPAGTLDGRDYYLVPGSPGQLYWFVDDNVAIRISRAGPQPPVEDLLRDLTYELPLVKCVVAEEITASGPCSTHTESVPVGAGSHTSVDVTGN